VALSRVQGLVCEEGRKEERKKENRRRKKYMNTYIIQDTELFFDHSL